MKHHHHSICNYDYIEIFDGNSITSPSLGRYCNTLTGSLVLLLLQVVQLQFYCTLQGLMEGFALNWSCLYPSAPPVTLFTADDTLSCSNTINFTDLSTNGLTTYCGILEMETHQIYKIHSYLSIRWNI